MCVQDSVIEKLRLKNSALKADAKKVQSQLQQKVVMGSCAIRGTYVACGTHLTLPHAFVGGTALSRIGATGLK